MRAPRERNAKNRDPAQHPLRESTKDTPRSLRLKLTDGHQAALQEEPLVGRERQQ
jgi:hypothetical protein